MADSISLEEIFETMYVNEQKVPIDLAEEWIYNNLSKYNKDPKYGKYSYKSKYDTSIWHITSKKDREKNLICFSQKLKQKEALLTQILCYEKYTIADSKRIVKDLQAQFDYFSEFAFLLVDLNTQKCIVDVHPTKYDMPILGQIIAPILASGFTVRLNLSSEFSLFFIILAELLTDSGFPPAVFTLMDEQEVIEDKKIWIKNPQPDYYCPAILFEDADLDSAVECVVQGAWRYLGKVSWAIRHVYIQESIFKTTTEKLKARLLKMKIGTRFIKYCDLIEEPTCKTVEVANMEVFKPFESCPQCFYIGWDPLEHEDPSVVFSQPNPGVCLIPFRNMTEAIALVNKSRFGCFASVWTERISTAKKITNSLEFGTIWINSHGLFHPSIPIESMKESKFPINGQSLLTALLTISMNDNDEGKNNFSWEKVKTEISASECVSKDIYSAVERARISQKSWRTKSQEERFKNLCDFLQIVEQIIQSEIKGDLMNAIRNTLYDARFCQQSFTHRLETMDVTCTSQPIGITWIILSQITPLILEQLMILIFCLLVHGNSVILSARTDELKRIAMHVCGIFEKCKLQNGLLNFVTELFDLQKLYETGSVEYTYCKVINRFITFGKNSFTAPLGQNIEFFQDGIGFYENRLLQDLTTLKKCVWVPNT